MTKLWLVAQRFNLLPFSEELLSLSMTRLDWIIQMMARDDPTIQITNAGEPEKTPDQIKTLSLVGAWDTMRGQAKQDFLASRIPVKIREAMIQREKLKQPRGSLA